MAVHIPALDVWEALSDQLGGQRSSENGRGMARDLEATFGLKKEWFNFMPDARHKPNSLLVNGQQVVNAQLDFEDQTNDEQGVGVDWHKRGRFQSKRARNEFLHVFGQRLSRRCREEYDPCKRGVEQ